MFVEQVSQRAYGEREQFGGVGLVSGGPSQGFEHVGLFQLIQMGGEIESRFRKLETFRDAVGIVVGNLFRQAFGLNRVGRFQRDRAFDGVFEFANISGPQILFQQTQPLPSLIVRLRPTLAQNFSTK